MALYRVIDLRMDDVIKSAYDLAIFASGYEGRCTYVARHVRRARIGRPIVLGFRELMDHEQRSINDRYFGEEWTRDHVIVSADDEEPIYEILGAIGGSGKDRVTVLVDYSSMSRLWYAAVLNWARFVQDVREVNIDCLYSVGKHKDSVAPMVIKDILSIPGCEGGPVPLFKSVAVFGLGFDGLATLCVLDRMEPDDVYAYLASPAAFPDYPGRARESNEELIKRYAKDTLELPLGSVERTFSHLAELIAPHRADADITMVPMGPKPHVLAAILLAMRFDEIGCLRVSGKRTRPEDVGTTGDIVATRVQFRRERPSVSDEFHGAGR